jgi:uncharacterized protein (DUF433 family)
MISTPATVSVPLRVLEDGTIRVGQSRILLELVIHAYWRGATAESIVESFPSLKLEDVYPVIAYYLQNRDQIDAYIRQADAEGEQKRQEAEKRDPELIGLRERLLARMKAQSGDDALRG